MSSRSVRRRDPASPVRFRESVEDSLILALFDLVNHLQRRGERLAMSAELTTQQWLVLLQIAGDPNFPAGARTSGEPLLASEIARVRGVSRAAISAVVHALKQRGLIREHADPEDRRRRYLVATPAGIEALGRIEPDRRAANQRLLADLDPGERKKMLSYVRSCLSVLWDAYENEQLHAARQRLRRPRKHKR